MSSSPADWKPECFAENGFAVVPGAISPAELDNFRSAVDRLVQSFDPDVHRTVFSSENQAHARDTYFLRSGSQISYFLEEDAVGEHGEPTVSGHEALNKIGHAMHDLDPGISEFCRSGAFEQLARAVNMVNPALLQSMIIFKNPHIGGEVHVHTDHTFLWTEPQSVTGFWVAIDDATEENGCLWAMPGGHTIPVKSRFQRTVAGDRTEMLVFDDRPYPDEGWVPLEVEAGTMIAIHGTLPHYSAANRSPKPRLAFTLHCIEQDSAYPANNWLQRPDLPLRGFR